jgi:hypothetical protein
MNDALDPIQDPIQTQPTPDSPPASAGFCQQCGKPLTTETVRKVGTAVFCEPCLAARIGAPPIPGAGYRPVNAVPRPTVTGWPADTLNQPAANASPNPGLAALLGLIPGVGAMYNEQYAKGAVHLVVFAVLCSLSDHVNGIFGLFVAGWIFYMAIEAHHTARARRDGTPLPNPFGLNDVGERMGFGRSWPAGPSVAEVANDAATAAKQAAAQAPYAAQPSVPPVPPAPPYQPVQPWGAPVETVIPPRPIPGSVTYSQPFVDAAYAQAYRDMGYGSPIPTPGPGASPGYTPIPSAHVAPTPYPVPYTPAPNRFPAGAVVLIGLGTVFLLTTTGIFNGFPPEALIGIVLLGLSVWFFLRRMLDSGPTLGNDYTPGYFLRVYQALQASVWTGLIGLLLLLDGFDILRWSHSWPFFIILPGVMALLSRAAYQTAYIPPPPAPSMTSTTGKTDSTEGAL